MLMRVTSASPRERSSFCIGRITEVTLKNCGQTILLLTSKYYENSMEEDSNYQHFIISVNQELARSGWEVSEKFSDLGDVAMHRTDSIALVFTHRFMVVKQGDGLSKDDIVSLVTKAHRRLESIPPLFPSTCMYYIVCFYWQYTYGLGSATDEDWKFFQFYFCGLLGSGVIRK